MRALVRRYVRLFETMTVQYVAVGLASVVVGVGLAHTHPGASAWRLELNGWHACAGWLAYGWHAYAARVGDAWRWLVTR